MTFIFIQSFIVIVLSIIGVLTTEDLNKTVQWLAVGIIGSIWAAAAFVAKVVIRELKKPDAKDN